MAAAEAQAEEAYEHLKKVNAEHLPKAAVYSCAVDAPVMAASRIIEAAEKDMSKDEIAGPWVKYAEARLAREFSGDDLKVALGLFEHA